MALVPHTRLLLAVATTALALALWPGAAGAAERVWAVGDGGLADPSDDAVAAMVQRQGIDRLLYLGDVYEDGTAREYAAYYHPSWGRFKAITHPTPGNHEWSHRAEGYDPYWGARAPRQPGGGHYYSFDVEGWHVVSLNTQEDAGYASAQVRWLRADLARYDGTCTIAFQHRARYSAGPHGDDVSLEPLYGPLEGRAVALLSGHDHNYQRLAAQRGIVQLVVGTGGASLSGFDPADPRLLAGARAFGALDTRLHPGRMTFRFVRLGGGVADAGSLPCRPHRPRVTIAAPPASVPALRVLRGQSHVARGPVRLTILRRASRGCSAFDGRRLRPASCRTRRAVTARGLARWRYALPRGARLAPGRYVVTARVGGYAAPAASAVARFRISG